MPSAKPANPPKAAAHRKPQTCIGCSLYERGHGFVPPSGPANSPVMFFGEAPGYEEAATGIPFIGAAGSMLDRILKRNQLTRQSFRVGNVLSCVPPAMELRGAAYEFTAIDHCRVHRTPVLAEPHQVVMALGATPLRTLLGLHGHDRIRVEEFHGTVHRSLDDKHWIVPSFHPSYLQRGAHNLIGTVSYDLQVALEVARGQWKPQPINLVIDPPVDWLAAGVVQLESAARQDPYAVAVSCDMETPDKAGGRAENELGPDDQSYQIDRWNFSWHPDEGITIPNHPDYWPWIKRILELSCYHYWWNGSGYDWSRTFAAGYRPIPRWQLDLMLGAHVLQSDVPLGLGFWAPFYSNYGAWKHLSGVDPEKYACIDGPQTQRVGYGIIGDLIQHGQWRAFEEDCHELFHSALKPAQDIGILIDKPALEAFHQDLETKQRRLMHEIQGCIPEDLRPLTQETKRGPVEGLVHPQARTHNLRTGEALKDQPDPIKQDLFALGAVRVSREVKRVIKVCKACGKEEVHAKHRCEDKSLTPQVELEEKLVVRWFWQEPFNPDSSQQVLAYLKFRGHKPGKSKQTREDSADRETLQRLWKSTTDPFYKHLIDYRAIKKVDSTYAVPTMRRITKEIEAGREPRIHPIVTFRPSMGRLSYISPNITNVVADKDKRRNLAAGFRRCVVAAPGCRLLEVDYSGIEAVETGWYARDPAYIRLARLGVHAYLASHLLGRPADLRWSDADLTAYFQELKKAEPWTYDQAKRCVHGCVTGDHEVLTPKGWVRFDTLKDGQEIAIWDPKTSEIRFEVPTRVTRDPHQGPMIGLGGQAIEILGTPEHRLGVRQNGNAKRVNIHTLETLPKFSRLPLAGVLHGQTPLHESLLLAVAVQADGSIQENGSITFHLKKLRKIARLIGYLDTLQIPWTESDNSDGSKTIRIAKTFAATALGWLKGPEKTFDVEALLQLTAPAKVAFLQELPYWDGASTDREPNPKRVRREYITTSQENAVIAQTIAHTAGMQGLLHSYARGGRKVLYRVSFNRRTHARVEQLIRNRQENWQCTVYCVTVSTEHFLLRYRDKVMVSANTNYGLTPLGMSLTFPEIYSTLAAAEKVQRIYFDICPALPVWHAALREWAYDKGWLGGPGEVITTADNRCYKKDWQGPPPWAHPFQYKHWFWSVLQYTRLNEKQYLWRMKRGMPVTEIQGTKFGIGWGEDSKRVIAFYPQSTAAGVLKRTILDLHRPESPNYIGDVYNGQTCFRAPIHDSGLFEIPIPMWDDALERIARAFQTPISQQPVPAEWNMGQYLQVGVEAKAGTNWLEMEKIELPAYAPVVGSEGMDWPIEESDEEDFGELGTVA